MSATQLAKYWIARLNHVDENSKATDIGLLVVRITVCVCIFYHHGAEKFYDFHTLIHHPLDPVGIGVLPSVIFAGFTDGICSLLILFGLLSRYASFFSLVCLNVVWWIIDHGLLHILRMPIPLRPGAHAAQVTQVIHTIPNYMNVPLYILGFLIVFIAGPGRYSLDYVLEKRKQTRAHVAGAVSVVLAQNALKSSKA